MGTIRADSDGAIRRYVGSGLSYRLKRMALPTASHAGTFEGSTSASSASIEYSASSRAEPHVTERGDHNDQLALSMSVSGCGESRPELLAAQVTAGARRRVALAAAASVTAVGRKAAVSSSDALPGTGVVAMGLNTPLA